MEEIWKIATVAFFFFSIPLSLIFMKVIGIFKKEEKPVTKKEEEVYTLDMFIADAVNPEISIEELMEKAKRLPPRMKKTVASPIIVVSPPVSSGISSSGSPNWFYMPTVTTGTPECWNSTINGSGSSFSNCTCCVTYTVSSNS